MTKRARLRELGIRVGRLEPGPLNAITDVAGVEVGYATLVEDAPAILRTGVTAIWPGGRDILARPVFAGIHSFNGNGEMTGSHWIAEQGMLTTPIAITNTHSVGLVRDAVGAYLVRNGGDAPWLLPVAAETYDGRLSDSERLAITMDHVFAALASASGGAIAEGNVGGGTGMICHEFKGAPAAPRAWSTRAARATRWVRSCRRITGSASSCASTACRWARRSASMRCPRRGGPRAIPARSSWCSRPTRHCCRSN